MKHYPDYRFLQSQPVLYAYVKEHYPDLYEDIKRAVKAGQWIVDGGMWVECDTNLPCGESLVRQFLYGKRFMREVFGVDSKVAWLPDVFGTPSISSDHERVRCRVTLYAQDLLELPRWHNLPI